MELEVVSDFTKIPQITPYVIVSDGHTLNSEELLFTVFSVLIEIGWKRYSDLLTKQSNFKIFYTQSFNATIYLT